MPVAGRYPMGPVAEATVLCQALMTSHEAVAATPGAAAERPATAAAGSPGAATCPAVGRPEATATPMAGRRAQQETARAALHQNHEAGRFPLAVVAMSRGTQGTQGLARTEAAAQWDMQAKAAAGDWWWVSSCWGCWERATGKRAAADWWWDQPRQGKGRVMRSRGTLVLAPARGTTPRAAVAQVWAPTARDQATRARHTRVLPASLAGATPPPQGATARRATGSCWGVAMPPACWGLGRDWDWRHRLGCRHMPPVEAAVRADSARATRRKEARAGG